MSLGAGQRPLQREWIVLLLWGGLMARVWWPAGVPFLLVGLGWALTRWSVARVTQDTVCVKVLLWAYVAKVAFTAFLYYSSVNNWPILSAYNGGEGYWAFADDAQAHHNYGLGLARAWAGQGPFPKIAFGNWSFVVYTALVYLLLGPYPLNVSFLNAWYGTLMGLAGWSILTGCRARQPSIRLGVGLLAFWPSLLFWSSQPLKDPLILTLILGVLAIIVVLVNARRSAALPWTAWVGLLVVMTMLVALLRNYIGVAVGFVAFVTFLALLVQGFWTGAFVPTRRYLVVGILVPLAVLMGLHMNLQALARPTPAPLVPSPSSPPVVPSSLVSAPQKPSSLTTAPTKRSPAWKRLAGLRRGFVSTGGHSMLDPDVKFHGVGEALGYLPRGLSLALLAPLPRQWFDTSGRVGILRSFTAVEMVLIYLLLAGLLLRLPELWRQRSLPMAVLLLFVLVVAVPMSLTVANLGTLFRLRLQFLLPLWLVVSLGDILGFYHHGFLHLQDRLVGKRRYQAGTV